MTYLRNCGLALDESLNVLLLDGDPEQTISLHAAQARDAGARWGCVLCVILAVVVQRNHCALVLAGITTPAVAALRAGMAMLLLAIVLGALAYAAWTIAASIL